MHKDDRRKVGPLRTLDDAEHAHVGSGDACAAARALAKCHPLSDRRRALQDGDVHFGELATQ
jgi:hypothetical protein